METKKHLKLEALTDYKFEDLELYLDFNIYDSISDFCSKPQKSSIGCAPHGNQNLVSVPAELVGSFKRLNLRNPIGFRQWDE